MIQAEAFQSRITSWTDLTKLVEHFSYFSAHAWLFRGVADSSYGLVPKVGREETRAIKQDLNTQHRGRVPYRLEDEVAVFRMFKQQARSHLNISPTTDFEWLAVAQHFGLPTRLLDWTESLLVAAWFAVEQAGPNGKDAAIWVARGLDSIDADSADDPFRIDHPAVFRPAYVSPRIAAQASVLMVCPKPTEEVTPAFARQVIVSRDVGFLIKKRLNACGINKRQLFPDLSGLAEHLAWLYKRDYLAGYREGPSTVIDATPDDIPGQ